MIRLGKQKNENKQNPNVNKSPPMENRNRNYICNWNTLSPFDHFFVCSFSFDHSLHSQVTSASVDAKPW